VDREQCQPSREEQVSAESAVEWLPKQTVALFTSDHPGRTWLGSTLEQLLGTRIVAEVAEADKAVEAARTRRPDVIMLADELVAQPNTGLVREVHESSPTSRIIVIGEREGGESLLSLGTAGISGYLGWRVLDARKVRASLVAAAAGLKFATVEAAGEVVSPLERRRQRRGQHVVLTDREREVVRSLRAGLRAWEIAEKLGLTPRTVQAAIAKLEDKYDAGTLYELGTKIAADELDEEE